MITIIIKIIFCNFLIFIFIYLNNNEINEIYKIKINQKNIDKNENKNAILNSNNILNTYTFKNCYFPPDNLNIKVIHIISTRFLLEPQLWNKNNLDSKIYNNKYISNGFRVLKKYLLPSLENQSCKEFIWILSLGNKANITYIKSILNLNYSFKTIIIYQKSFRRYIRELSKGFDVLITTRIDYDDRIYYDAVNDVRKAININKPMLIYGYHRGLYYFEDDNKYYEFYENYNNEGALGIFISLITILKKVNDTYDISDLGVHSKVKKNFLKSFNKFGINTINYDPAILDSGSQKFVYIRQKYSNAYNRSYLIKKKLKECDFDLNKFYGK